MSRVPDRLRNTGSLGGAAIVIPSLLIVAGLLYLLHVGEVVPAGGFAGLRGGKLLIVLVLAQMLSGLAVALLVYRALAFVHAVSPRLAWGIVVGALLTLGIATAGVKYLKSAKARAREAAVAEVMQARRDVAAQTRLSQARAAEADRKNRAELIGRWRVARQAAIEQWRKDLIDARAVGGLGVAPPMLRVQDNGSLVTVTNGAKHAACVLITRVATRESAVTSRCTVGGNRCVVLQAGATARWPTLRAGNSESCLAGSLEYRVGNVDYPEPSWWSEGALGQFGSEDPDPEFIDRWSDTALITEIHRLEKQSEDRMRVER
jgi:hypothetical protein